MNMSKKKDFIINFVFYGILLGLLYIGFKYIAPILIPFMIGFIISYLIQRPVRYLNRKFQINKKILSMTLLLLFYVLISLLLFLLCINGYSWIMGITNEAPKFYQEVIQPTVSNLISEILSLTENMKPEFKAALDEFTSMMLDSSKQLLGSISNYAVSYVANIVKGIPGLFISFVMTIISSFFFIIDYDKIIQYLLSHMNQSARSFLSDTQYFLKNKLWVIIKAYAKIMTLTFVELSIGLSLIGIDHSVLIALAISIFDILPVLGTGGIMIPWSLICLIQGNFILGIELILVYVIITVIRNIVEPKIVGAELGIHPVATLMAMLVGGQLFGIIGLFGFPILLSFIIFKNEKNKNEKTKSIE